MSDRVPMPDASEVAGIVAEREELRRELARWKDLAAKLVNGWDAAADREEHMHEVAVELVEELREALELRTLRTSLEEALARRVEALERANAFLSAVVSTGDGCGGGRCACGGCV